MGCTQSYATVGIQDKEMIKNKIDSPSNKFKSSKSSIKSYDQIINEKCSHARVEAIDKVKYLNVESKKSSITLKYVYYSQRGYYPNAVGKANQDSYTVCESVLGDKNCHLFGIFDGHGEYGDYCSHYSASKVPHYLQKILYTNGGTSALESPNMETILTESFDKANKALRKSNVDDSLSGTTAITVVIKGDILYVCNVGDSRAIIAGEVNGYLKYSPLSSDQTPYRSDERARLKQCGAYIMTLEQVEGREPIHENWGPETGDTIDESGDPPRVWDKTLERPGCAFTRSLGDAVAESVGVNAIPEILTWELTAMDKYIIIASDGVFEFLTSQNVVNIISQYPDIIEGARRVVEESYRLWLTYDERTDDISIIIISIENFTTKKVTATTGNMSMKSMIGFLPSALGAVSGQGQGSNQQADLLIRNDSNLESGNNKSTRSYASHQLPENKPVRRVITKSRRKEIAENWVSNDIDENYNMSKHITRKTPEELARIADMVKSNFMFQNLSPVQRDQIFQVMQLKYIMKGQVIIKEGDVGDEMYFVDSGEFLCTKKDENGVTQPVFTYTVAGSSFGELSLMYGKPRAASVKATTDGRLWVLGRQAFRSVLVKRKQDDLLQSLQSIPVLNDLQFTQLQRICEATIEKDYVDGETIYSSEQPNDFIVNRNTTLSPTATAATVTTTTQDPSSSSSTITDAITTIPSITTVTATAMSSKLALPAIDTSSTIVQNNHTSLLPSKNQPTWMICIILAGQVQLFGKDGNPNRIRGIRSHIISFEIGKFYSKMIADGRTKVSFISESVFLDITGDRLKRNLVETILARNLMSPSSPVATIPPRSTRFKRAMSHRAFTDQLSPTAEEGIEMKSNINRHDYHLESILTSIGEYGYIGTFTYQGMSIKALNGSKYSAKVIAKKRAAIHSMDARLLQEKQILQSIRDECQFIPIIDTTAQDSRSILILYADHYVCDLSSAITSGKMLEKAKIYYIACIYSAIKALHTYGIMHRFVNVDSVFINSKGIAKIVDMRYAKKMNGSKSFTICGDPSNFAPEIISSLGYSYAVDLWAFGIVIYEVYEGSSPIAGSDSDEAVIFRAITDFRFGDLRFTKSTTPDLVKQLIKNLLQPNVNQRLGYKSSSEVTKHPAFEDIIWDMVGTNEGYPMKENVQAPVDTSSIFVESDLEEYNSAVFDRF